ncbi:MAG: RHS repeat-associated core domain-containing protein, partial [Thermodesulfobacteriota bacterium]
NPALFMPLAFAGGLRDRFTGLVRFCHRDYDPTIGRFTAPDPLGDTGGDHDLYDYCVDDPVGRIDPEGLREKAAQGQDNRPLELDEDMLRMTTVATPANDSTHSTMPNPESDWWPEAGSQPQDGARGQAEGADQESTGQQGSSEPGGREPGEDDPDDTVYVGSRKADLRWPLNQFDHKWLRTEKYESGMGQAPKDGQADGNVPGVEGRSDRPYAPTETVDHSGESQREGNPVRYEKVTGMNVDCVNARIKPGQKTGPWAPGFNDCHGFVGSILHDCKKGSFEEDFPYEPDIKPRSRK